ncbi:MAG TPA: tetratricopeptide repeat protein [Blastocatellia bacterium]
MMERRATQEVPVDLIESGQFLAAEEIFSERRTDDPLEMVVRAEVEMYFGRLDEAGALLDQVAPRANEMEVAARYSLASGRLATWRGKFELANTHLQTAYFIYHFQQDSFRTSMALLELGHFSRLLVDMDDAASKLSMAHDGIKGRTSKRADFLRGLVFSELGSLASDRGSFDQAAEHYTSALRLLKSTEKGRYYGRTLVRMGGLKCQLGEYQDSLELYKEANIVFERYDFKEGLAESQLDLANALVRMQRYERAERLCEESRDLRRGSPLGESAAFTMLAVLCLRRNGTDEAAGYALNAVELADESGNFEAKARARLALGQVKLAEREFKLSVETLNQALEIVGAKVVDGDNQPNSPTSYTNRLIRLEGVISLAEAYHNIDTRAGRQELARAEEILKNTQDAWLQSEFSRISNKYEEQIVFTDDNRLVFDGNQLPKWQEAKRTLEGFLLRNALRQTNNSLTRAARKLGVSKVHVHNLKKKHGL